MDANQLLLTGARALLTFAVMLVILRLMGKREIGSFSPFDLLVALMLGEIVDEAIYGDVSFPQFLVAALAIAGCQWVTGWLCCRSRKLEHLLEGVPTVLIRDGEMQRDAMRKERVTEEEIMELLREQSLDDLREVRLGTLESNGQLSVLKAEWAETVQKSDLMGEERRLKEQDTGGQEEPPVEKQTYSPQALGREAA
jgi:uncharacterized membrane protein YcaP (DUF421 family)